MAPMVSNKKSSLSDLRLCSLDPFALRECFCWNISPRSKGGKSEIEQSLAPSLLSLLTVALNCGRCVSVIKKKIFVSLMCSDILITDLINARSHRSWSEMRFFTDHSWIPNVGEVTMTPNNDFIPQCLRNILKTENTLIWLKSMQN